MRFILILISTMIISGCATVSPSFTYRPPNYNGKGWTISAKAEDKVIKDNIFITINGEEVINGSLHEFKKKDNFNGQYQGRNILAECALVSRGGLSYGHECSIFVENERAAFLSF